MFLMPMELVFIELHWRDNKGLLLRVANLLFQKFEEFPILAKFIDAKDNLSIQVHPDNEYAEK